MTKVSIFGQESEVKQGKPIEFVKQLFQYDESLGDANTQPKSWDNVQLFRKNDGEDLYDVIIAWDDDDETQRACFLGHWNDGFVKQ